MLKQTTIMNYQGLKNKEVEELRNQFGFNEIQSVNKLSAFTIFFNQLKNPLIYILLIAAAFSIYLKEAKDAGFIIAVVLINSILGFYQEYKAENTMEALQKRVSKTVKVIRGGSKQEIPARELVPGDLLVLEPGLRVAGDGVLLEATELTLNEALLTGESAPVLKKVPSNPNQAKGEEFMVFKGSAVIEGVGVAQIQKIGNETKFGQIAKHLDSQFNPVTPIKKELIRISKVITLIIIIITACIVVLGLLRGFDAEDIFLTAAALGVSTIPEGLLIALTITLAFGMNRIMAKQAVVKNLPAAETLGDIETLCVDKTGTLTLGDMRVADTDFTNKELAMKALAICNNESNFIDAAILDFIYSSSGKDFHKQNLDKRQEFFPFSSLKKYTGAYDGDNLYAVGAPEVILEFSKGESKDWQKKVTAKAQQGNRMVAVAYKKLAKTSDITRNDFKAMDFLGLVYVKDPVRKGVADSLRRIQRAGVDIKVITGDLKETSLSVLHSLDFDLEPNQLISGKEIAKITSQRKFDSIVRKTKLFYRTTPDQKLRIVKSLQRDNKRVGMMGDGVNDSPALKTAEIGISVDNATDVSKEVSDLILLDSNFQTIVDAIDEGRNIFQNLRKIMTYLFADSLSETVLIFLALLFGLPLPMLPLQLLWINIVEDGLPSLALSFDRADEDLLSRPPRKHNQSVFDKKVIGAIIAVSLIVDSIYFGIFKYLIDTGTALDYAQTIIFAGVSISSLFFLYSAKTLDTNLWKVNFLNDKFVNISVIVGILLTFIAVYLPPLQDLLGTVALSSKAIIGIFIIALLDTLLVELIKLGIHKRYD